VELEKIVEMTKRLGAGSVRYVKYSYAPATDTYHIKIYLVKPLEWKVLAELVKEVERHYSVKVYVPHAHALRLDLKKKSAQKI
jgi:sugar phosphate isomerase/epimerase